MIDEEPRPFVRLPGSIAPFGFRNFALLWAGMATSRFGRAMEEIGTVWLLYLLTDSPVLLGLLGLARAVPALIVGPIAGVIADRIEQRRLLFVTQGLGLVASSTLGLLVITGLVEFWHLYILVALQATIETFDGTARQAFFPRLVPRGFLPESVTLVSIAARVSTLVGPAAGGIAIALLGEASPFLLNAATFVPLMLALTLMRSIPPIVSHRRSGFRGELMEGFRHIVHTPVMSGLLRLELVFGLFQTNAVIITIVGLEIIGVGPEGLGGLLSAPALGALSAVIGLIALGQPKRSGRFVIGCVLTYAAVLVIFAFSTSYVVSFAALAAMGLLDSLSTVIRHSVMQLAAPPHMRGRIMANMGTVTRGTSPLAETQSGTLSGLFGPPVAVMIASVVMVLVGTGTAARNKALWLFERDPTAPGAAVATDDEAVVPGASAP